jgi:hypothetical protein
LQDKSEAFIVFKSFKVRVEKEFGKYIQILCTIMVVNLTHIILQVFVNYMEYAYNLLFHTHRNKMTWQKERIRRL